MKETGKNLIPFQHEMIDEWRENFKGVQFLHKKSNLLFTGAVDDVWFDTDSEELVVVDLGVGYMIQDKKSEKQGFGEDGFTPMNDEKKDGVRIAISLGTAF